MRPRLVGVIKRRNRVYVPYPLIPIFAHYKGLGERVAICISLPTKHGLVASRVAKTVGRLACQASGQSSTFH